MFKQILVQAANGFSVKDIPFFIFQVAVSAVLAGFIRFFWRKSVHSPEELQFLKFLLPLQIILTVVAIFSIQSPWVAVVFGLISLIPVIGNNHFGSVSKIYYLLCVFIAFGCGTSHILVTVLTGIVFLFPLLYFNSSQK